MSKKDDSTLDPFEINFLPEFKQDRGPREPFVNDYGVVIGDHEYDSENSPLNHWSKDTDPFIMAGNQWVHPYKDIGFRTPEIGNILNKVFHRKVVFLCIQRKMSRLNKKQIKNPAIITIK
jgi:hypothetical protein